jgi:serine kinase of HPr protein (carbohydrate metabolism regulator)
LALRCLGLGPSTIVRDGVILVADDQVELKHQDGHLTVSAPAALRGKIEIRGLGILEVDAIPKANLVLVVDLIRDGLVERYPDPWLFTSILDFDVPVIRIFPFETSSALKLVAAIHMAPGPRVSSKA